MSNTLAYPYIVAWHKLTGSYDYYINRLCELAANEHAPHDSIFKEHTTKKWMTVADLEIGHPMIDRMNEYLNY